jgi:hypothetical protein
MCVRILLYVCPHTTICVSAYYHICVRILLYVCPHTTICVSAHYHLCVRTLLYVCPHTTICVSAHYYMCVRTLPYVCPHTTICVSACPHTTVEVLLPQLHARWPGMPINWYFYYIMWADVHYASNCIHMLLCTTMRVYISLYTIMQHAYIKISLYTIMQHAYAAIYYRMLLHDSIRADLCLCRVGWPLDNITSAATCGCQLTDI